MKTLALAVLSTTILLKSAGTVSGYDFEYGYKTVLSANADQYVFSIQNAQKYDEGTPGASYWAPSANNVPSSVTYRFDFAAPTTEVFVFAQVTSYNFGGGTFGSTSLYGSTDGVDWELLLDNPTPGSIDSYAYYNQNVPNSLLRESSFWLQARMQSAGWTIMAQHSHYGQGNSFDGFEVKANVVPEPSALLLSLLSSVFFAMRRNRQLTVA
jgi:hypothetical protein